MHFSQAIDAIAKAVPNDFSSLSEALSPELINTCLAEAGMATLRSRTPEMIHQKLWGTLLAYNLIRFQMARMAYS